MAVQGYIGSNLTEDIRQLCGAFAFFVHVTCSPDPCNARFDVLSRSIGLGKPLLGDSPLLRTLTNNVLL